MDPTPEGRESNTHLLPGIRARHTLEQPQKERKAESSTRSRKAGLPREGDETRERPRSRERRRDPLHRVQGEDRTRGEEDHENTPRSGDRRDEESVLELDPTRGEGDREPGRRDRARRTRRQREVTGEGREPGRSRIDQRPPRRRDRTVSRSEDRHVHTQTQEDRRDPALHPLHRSRKVHETVLEPELRREGENLRHPMGRRSAPPVSDPHQELRRREEGEDRDRTGPDRERAESADRGSREVLRKGEDLRPQESRGPPVSVKTTRGHTVRVRQRPIPARR